MSWQMASLFEFQIHANWFYILYIGLPILYAIWTIFFNKDKVEIEEF